MAGTQGKVEEQTGPRPEKSSSHVIDFDQCLKEHVKGFNQENRMVRLCFSRVCLTALFNENKK